MSSGNSEPPAIVAEVTQLLHRVRVGDEQAVNDLLPLVYNELRARAASYFRAQPSDHTLQPTALVHEAFIRLVRSSNQEWNGRSHFCAVAATAMRQILTDHARRRAAAKNAVGEHHRTRIDPLSETSAVDVIAVDEALKKLTERNREQARLVELRFFGGLSIDEAAEVLKKSESTLKRDWRKTRAWLLTELRSGDAP